MFQSQDVKTPGHWIENCTFGRQPCV